MFGKTKDIGLIASAANRRICVATVAALWLAGIDSQAQTAAPTNPSGAADTTSSDHSSETSAEKKKNDFQLTTVVVSGQTRLDQAAAYDTEQQATYQLNVLSQQAIQQTPAKTVGQAVAMLPGVGLQHDTGEPRFAQIRGTDENLNTLLYNGVVLPSYFPGYRAVPVDALPVGLISNIDVIKTLLPYMDAEGIGGQFNLEPKSAFDYSGLHAEVTGEGGYVPYRSSPIAYGSFTLADTFKLGDEAKLGILVSGLYDFKRFGIDDLEEAYSTPGNAIVDKSISNYTLRYYTYERTRFGIGTNIDLQLNPDNRFYLDFAYGGYNERRIPRFETIYGGLDVTSLANVLPNGSYSSTPGNATVQKTMEDTLQENRFFTIIAGGENKLYNADLTYKAAYSQATQDQPYYNKYTFNSLPGSIGGSVIYNNQANGGDSPTIDLSHLTGQNDPHNYVFNNVVNQSFSSADKIFNIQGDIKFSLPIGDNPGVLQLGTSARLRWRNFDQTYTGRTATDPSGTSNSLFLSQALNSNLATIYYGRYPIGPQISFNTGSVLANNPQYSTATDESLANSIGTWSANENVYAGYIMYTVTFDKLTIEGGVRVEGTNFAFDYNQGIFDPTTGALLATRPGSGSNDYVNILPNLQLTYNINPQWVARLSYTKSVARPTFQQGVPAIENGDLQATIPGTEGFASQTFGNANLKATRSHNLDASIEYYPTPGAILRLSVFDKEISDYVVQNYFINSAGGSNVSFSSINHSRIYGFEAEYEQQFVFLPQPFDGFGVRGSFARIFSAGVTHPGQPAGNLPSQAGLVWNAGLYYQKYGWSFFIGGTFTGHNLLAVGAPARNLPTGSVPASADTYFDGYVQLDAKLAYSINRYVTVFVEGNNLNNGALRFYAGNPNHPLQTEYYGPTVDGGLTVTF
jgi:TonB-dependent receptor